MRVKHIAGLYRCTQAHEDLPARAGFTYGKVYSTNARGEIIDNGGRHRIKPYEYMSMNFVPVKRVEVIVTCYEVDGHTYLRVNGRDHIFGASMCKLPRSKVEASAKWLAERYARNDLRGVVDSTDAEYKPKLTGHCTGWYNFKFEV